MAIYPAHAGINRDCGETYQGSQDLPRTRGDKPFTPGRHFSHMDLPRTRGDKPELRMFTVPPVASTPHTRG